MLLDFDGETLVRGIDGGASGHGPRFEYSVPFEPQVVVQLACGVLLHDETQAGRGRHPCSARGLLGFGKVALCAIDGERRLGQDQVPCRSIMRR
jgi:hypothetical protein